VDVEKNEDMFLVFWKGVWETGPKKGQEYDIEDCTWLSRSALKNASHKVGQFENPDKFLNLKIGEVYRGFGNRAQRNRLLKVKYHYLLTSCKKNFIFIL
jgi:hypothetical protein